MTLPFIFGTLPPGNTPASDLDTNFSILEGAIVQPVTSTGSANAYILTPTDAWVTGYSLYKGVALSVIFNASNTSAATVNVSGLGSVNLYKNVGGVATALTTGDIYLNVPYVVICDGSNFWLAVSTPPAATTSVAGIVQLADAATTHTATSTTQVAAVGLLSNHPGVAKAWVNFTPGGTPTINASYNVASVTESATGKYVITFTNAMTDANYCISGFCVYNSGGFLAGLLGGTVNDFSQSTGNCHVQTGDSATGNPTEMSKIMVIIHGN